MYSGVKKEVGRGELLEVTVLALLCSEGRAGERERGCRWMLEEG